MSKFAIVFTCKLVMPVGARPFERALTEEGEQAWLIESDGYRWGETFRTCPSVIDRQHIPGSVILFDSREAAEATFHKIKTKESRIGPWYVKPRGEFEIIEVRQKFKQVPDGYEEVK